MCYIISYQIIIQHLLASVYKTLSTVGIFLAEFFVDIFPAAIQKRH